MANKRIAGINQEIQKELSALLRNVKDPRVQDTMISITRVMEIMVSWTRGSFTLRSSAESSFWIS